MTKDDSSTYEKGDDLDPSHYPLDTLTSHTHTNDSIDLEKARPPTILNKAAPYPHRQRALNFDTPHAVTIGAGAGYERRNTLRPTFTNVSMRDNVAPDQINRELHIQRTNSISLSTGPMRGDRAARTVADFRTLSLGVKDTQRSEEAEKMQKVGKKEVKDLANLDFHRITVDDILQRFSTASKTGLDSEQAVRRLKSNGANKLSPPPRNLWKKWLGYVFGGFGSLLLGASILCFIAWRPLGDPNPAVVNLALAIVLLVVIILQTGFNAWQDYSTGRVMASISGMLPSEVFVLRDGMEKCIAAEELVTGDVVFLKLGQKLPADMRFINVSSDLKLDRAVLTGESEPIQGTIDCTDDNFLETKNIGLQGTLCVSGSGTGVVVQTGDNTVFGRIAKLSSSAASQGSTTLQREITRFVIIIASLAAFNAIAVIIMWAAFLNPKHKGFMPVSALVINIVSVAVAMIPEGLPASITMSLSIIANKLASRKVLCKTLMTVETLGACNVICSDKTGTLTQNKMTVVNACLLDDAFSSLEARDALIAKDERRFAGVRQLAAVAGICNAAAFDESEMDQPADIRKVNGDATDSAILRFAESLRPVKDSNADWIEVYKVNFNSKTKFMLKLLKPVDANAGVTYAPIEPRDNFENGDLVLLVKGGPDVLMTRCTQIVNRDGQEPAAFDEAAKARLVKTQETWAAKGQRVLLLARKVVKQSDLPKGVSFDSQEFADYLNMNINQGLTVVGLLGLVDPPKADIPSTVATLRGAYIRFFMVTGDFPLTALAIAEQCGIVTNAAMTHRLEDLNRDLDISKVAKYDQEDRFDTRSLVLSGSDLMTMNESQWEQACQYPEVVFARTTPEQKLRIVKEMQARGGIVAVTGDGVNDSPALSQADIGIAVGGASTADVALEAADLILLESFSSIIVAVEYGRLVFDNLKKTVLYLLPAGSFSELMPIILNVFLGLPQALSSIQMILICVVTDVFAAVALCFEKPEMGLLTRRPRDVKKDRLVDWKLLVHAYLVLGVIESLCAMSMAFWYLQRNGVAFSNIVAAYGGWRNGLTNDFVAEKVSTAQSIYFFTLIIMQWGNLLSTRTRNLSIFQHPPISRETGNRYLLPAMLAALAFAFFFCYVPVFQRVFLTRGIPVEYIFLPFAFALFILMLDETRKYFVRRNPKGILARIAW